jgi:hypothetical protein
VQAGEPTYLLRDDAPVDHPGALVGPIDVRDDDGRVRSRVRWPWVLLAVLLPLLVAAVAGAIVLLGDRGPTIDRFDGERANIDRAAPTANPHDVRWRVDAGSMSTARGVLEGRPSARGNPAIAVLDLGDRRIDSVRASWTTIGTGSGIVFRYQSPAYHWMLTAAPRFGSWNLHRRIDGETTFVRNIPYSARERNEVEVRLEADGISVWIDGQPRLTVVDPLLVSESAAGVIISADGPEARVDEFEVRTS